MQSDRRRAHHRPSRPSGPRRRSRRALPVLLGVLCALSLAAPAPAEVRWLNGPRQEAEVAAPAELASRLRALAARPGQRHAVVQFAGPVDRARRAELEASGVRLLDSLGDHAWFAALEDGLDAAGAAGVAGLVAVSPIAVQHKLHPDLARGVIRPWAVVDEVAKKTPSGEPGPAPADPRVAVYVLFHRDVALEAEAPAVIAAHGGHLRSWMRSIGGGVVHLPASAVEALAAEDAVRWVEPPLPPWRELNDDNRLRVGADVLQQAPHGLTGAGVDVLVYDGGQMADHGDFDGRLTIGDSDTAGISDHATHVGGTIGGTGAGSTGGQYRGMAPGVSFISYGFEQEGGLSQGFLYTDPGDLEADYAEAISLYGADISNNSIGTNTAANGFPCEWEGNYGATGALIDAIARGSLGQPFRIVWANGNERGSGACGSGFLTTAPPACAKNHITVGALNSNDDSITSFTSFGPCDDGRLKPDVSAPGCQSGDDGGVTSTGSSGGYNTKCGTSMASPTVCGVSALLLERYRATFPDLPDPRNSTLKAVLANTAQDIDQPGPDYKTGYGSVRAVPAAELIAGERVIEAEVAQGETYAFLVLVDAGDPELKVTLAWDDPPGTPNVEPVLVNDLDLRVIGPAGGIHLPWTLDPADPGAPAVRTQRDGVNNVEQVSIADPAPGAYRVEVSGFAIAEGPTQPFGAAATPTLVNCSSAGVLTADRNRITCEAELGLRVIDCDLNTDDATVESVDIGATSGSEPGGETLTLVESAPEAAAFVGSIDVSTSDAPGVLQVVHGDVITASYVDADDGQGGAGVTVTRQVDVDCQPPAIVGVAVLEVNPRDALVQVEVDEPARVTLIYGTDCLTASETEVALAPDTLHELRLIGLQDDTTYAFSVAVEDVAGNVASDDNGGQCYTFTTPEVPDFFTERFSGGIDLEGLSLTFTPSGTVDFYQACAEPLLGGLPTDPSGGTDLDLSDDQPKSFALAGGAQAWLYGVPHDTIHVGPNGFLTFGEGDSDYSETLQEHFELPRVAAVYDDLNPSSGGSVTWRQLTDRVAVSWVDVPEYSTSNSNTFQIEMFFDGRIRMSWATLDAGDAIAGLSEGEGLDPDFLPTDLSALAGCGPRPPFAQPQSLVVEVAGSLPITLAAQDDGLPEPAALSYRIVSLPALGVLTDPATGQSIGAVPYELAGGATSVTYTAVPSYQGQDGFAFTADDGGSAPDGGQSQPAAISIAVGGPQPLYEFMLDDQAPAGWIAEGGWAFGEPTGGGSHGGDPAGGATGSNVYGYVLDGDYPNNMPQESLISAPVDLTGATQTRLEFQRWLGIESSSYDHAAFQLSTDGGASWTTLWEHDGSSFSDSAWSLSSHDVSGLADGQPAVSFRWVMGTTDGSVTYPGWNVDDVRVLGVIEAACSAPPSETPDLRFEDPQTLRWGPTPFFGGEAPVHDVLRSTAAADFSAATCLATDVAGTTAGDPDPVPVGALYHYLVRGENGCGQGGAGQSSAGQPRPVPSCPAVP